MQKPTRRHSTDELVTSTIKNGKEVVYKQPRYERYTPITNKGKIYPFGSKRQGF